MRTLTLLVALCLAMPGGAFAAGTDARKVILTNKARLFTDPDSVRDASIGTVAPCPSGNGECVCLELNSRNSQGGMTGLQTVGIRINADGTAKSFGEMAKTDDCGKMLPFPQLGKR